MSYTEPSADAGQPDQGQAADATPSVPYQEYLDRVPEEVRGDIAPIFHDWNSGINRRFEEHATYRKQWEPYEQKGLSQYPAETLEWAVQTLQNPQQAREWLDQQYGPAAQPEPQAAPQESYGEFVDPTQQFDQKLDPILQRLEKFEQRWQEQERQQQEARIQSEVDAEIAKLKELHGNTLPEKVREDFSNLIETFGSRHAVPGASPAQIVAKAWADVQALANQFGTAALQQKVDQPQTPVTGGEADLTPDEPKTLAEARKIALEQLRSNRAA